jgi:hypothetical protein
MGLLQLPRIYFKGYTHWNPSTFNNNDFQPTYDAANARLNWTWLERHGAHTPAAIDRYAVQPGVIPTANEVEIPQGNPNFPPAEWNYYGGNSCGFVGSDEPVIEWPAMFSRPAVNTTVSGFTDASGAYDDRKDPWIGLQPRMNANTVAAKLVDVDPVCVWSSQIFVDTFSLGAPSNGRGFTGATAGRAHSRWFNIHRNLNDDKKVFIAGSFAAVFQIGLPADSITFFDLQPSSGSVASQLRAALDKPGIQGLLVRFTTYLTIYFQGKAFEQTDNPYSVITGLYSEYATAVERYRAGTQAEPPAPPVNRAYSRTIGWIGPWADHELRSMPGGRLLSTATWTSPLRSGLPPTLLGPAVIECGVDPSTQTVTGLSIDLGSTVPELDSTAAKVDFGTMYIGLMPRDKFRTPVAIASIQYAGGYDQPSYERTAGVLDIPATSFLAPVVPSDLQDKRFAVWFDPSKPSLEEAPFTAQTDARGIYVDEPNATWDSPDRYRISIQVRYLDGKPPRGTRLCVVQYSPNRPLRPTGWSIISASPDNPAQSAYVELTGDSVAGGDGYIVLPVPYVEDGSPFGVVEVSVKGIRPGFPIIAFYPIAPDDAISPPPPSVDSDGVCRAFFCVVRVLPFHNRLALDFLDWLKTAPTADLVTQRVFDQVFRTYFLVYPVMRFIRDPLQFQAWRGRIVELTDPKLFETASFMPVTRELSSGQRRMLMLWNYYLDGTVIPYKYEPVGQEPRRA